MDEDGFREFIKEGKKVPKGLSEDTIKSHIRMVKEFEAFLRKSGSKRQFSDANERDVKEFIKHLAKKKRNTFENLIGVLRYARFSGNEGATIALLVILDSGSILQSLCKSFDEKHEKRTRDKVLKGFEPPPIGTSPKRMPKATTEFMERLESGIGEAATRGFLEENCPHADSPDHYAEERTLFLASKDIDDYLRKRREQFIEELEGHAKNGTLYYTQRIDDKVLDFVRRNPEIGSGIRRGRMIVHTKIPYMTIDYLKEEDPTRKRYHCCHCPLARESILSGETMSRNLCYCSAGYTKRPFEIAFGKPLKAEVKKSALWGDPVCEFAVEIPEELIPNKR